MPRVWMRRIAIALGLGSGGFWLFFSLAEFFSSWPPQWSGLIEVATVGLPITVATIVAWRWATVGGLLLLLEAVLYFRFFFWAGYLSRPGASPASPAFVFVFMLLPFPLLVSGVLFLAARWLGQRSPR